VTTQGSAIRNQWLVTRDQAADERIATRTSTRTDEASGDVIRKRNRAPSATRGGTVTRTGWWSSDSPVPRQRWHRHHEAGERLALRERHVGPQDVRVHGLPQEGIAHPFDDAPH